MNELAQEDEALLACARRGLEPTERDRTRNRKRLLAEIGTLAGGVAVAGAMAAHGSVAGGTAGGVGTTNAALVMGLLKVVAMSAIVGSVAGAGLGLADRSEARAASRARVTSVTTARVGGVGAAAPTAPKANAPAVATPVVFAPAAAPAALAVTSPAAPPLTAAGPVPMSAVPRVEARSAAPPVPVVIPDEPAEVRAPAPPAAPASTLAAEAALLREAGLAASAGDATRAMALLQQHAARFPAGALIEEREAETVVVLCALGRSAEARTAASEFLQKRPRSPLASRVRGSCGGM